MVTGAKGQLGSELREISEKYSHKFHFLDIEELDITKKGDIFSFVSLNQINVIINCAAYTAVDKAEVEPELADQINHIAVGYLAEIANKYQVKLIHISTDYVFDGENYMPYQPLDVCLPKSEYGKSKRLGEEKILELSLKDAVIIRTAWVYSTFGNNFVKTILRLSKERESLNVVDDQIGSPTNARDLALFILENLDKIKWSGTKIFHFTNEGVCSWYDLAKMICEIKKIRCEIRSIPSSEYPTPARRPFYSVLSKEDLKKTFNYKIPYWLDSLKDCLGNIDQNWKMDFLDKTHKNR